MTEYNIFAHTCQWLIRCILGIKIKVIKSKVEKRGYFKNEKLKLSSL